MYAFVLIVVGNGTFSSLAKSPIKLDEAQCGTKSTSRRILANQTCTGPLKYLPDSLVPMILLISCMQREG